jgi:hypothetical protein
MDASQKTSSITILVRLGACAAIGVVIFLLVLGLFMSHGTATMCLAGILVIGLAVVVLEVNPRKLDDEALVEIYLASNSNQAMRRTGVGSSRSIRAWSASWSARSDDQLAVIRRPRLWTGVHPDENKAVLLIAQNHAVMVP